jgi:hypothetical protein
MLSVWATVFGGQIVVDDLEQGVDLEVAAEVDELDEGWVL